MQKVKITYTADFNDVPMEISSLLQKSVEMNENVNVKVPV